jgi:hypothetical protein
VPMKVSDFLHSDSRASCLEGDEKPPRGLPFTTLERNAQLSFIMDNPSLPLGSRKTWDVYAKTPFRWCIFVTIGAGTLKKPEANEIQVAIPSHTSNCFRWYRMAPHADRCRCAQGLCHVAGREAGVCEQPSCSPAFCLVHNACIVFCFSAFAPVCVFVLVIILLLTHLCPEHSRASLCSSRLGPSLLHRCHSRHRCQRCPWTHFRTQ